MVFSCNQSKHKKIRTRKNSVLGNFSRSVLSVSCQSLLVCLRLFIYIKNKNDLSMEPDILGEVN